MDHRKKNQLVKSSPKNLAAAFGLAAVGLALAVGGIYVGDTDDAPGAALLGILLMIGAVIFAVRIALRGPHLKGEEANQKPEPTPAARRGSP